MPPSFCLQSLSGTVLAFILKQRTIRNRKGRGSDPIPGTLCSVLAFMFCIAQDIQRTGLELSG